MSAGQGTFEEALSKAGVERKQLMKKQLSLTLGLSVQRA